MVLLKKMESTVRTERPQKRTTVGDRRILSLVKKNKKHLQNIESRVVFSHRSHSSAWL